MSDKRELYIVSSSPHIKNDEDTRSCMLDVIIALLPALAIAVYFFGWRSFTLTVVSAAACMGFELLWQKLMKKPVRIGDLSCVVTGMLFAFSLPVTTPYWMVIVGAAFAIIVVKQLFGGIGKNFMNPALAARVFLFSWSSIISAYPQPVIVSGIKLPVFGELAIKNGAMSSDIVSSATPLASMKSGMLPEAAGKMISLSDMALGNIAGSFGEVSAFMLIIGGIYLLLRGVITPRIPVAFIGSVAVLTYLFPKGGNDGMTWMLYSILSGGVMLGAIFMATDYTTSPTTRMGQWIFGAGCGILTVFIRYFGAYPEGVAFAILIMNTFTWIIETNTRPRRFGTPLFKKRAKAKGKAGEPK